MELSLSQAFGVNASQTIDSLIINKTDLPSLTPLGNNTADSLVVALILQLLINFEGNVVSEKNHPVVDQNNIPLTFDNSGYWNEVGLNYWGRTFRNGFMSHIFLFYQYQLYTSI